MGRETAHGIRRLGGQDEVGSSPFVLWEGGGRAGRGDDVPRAQEARPDPLALALPTPRLFPGDSSAGPMVPMAPAERDSASRIPAAGAMGIPPSAKGAGIGLECDGDAGATGRPLDWQMIWAGLLVCVAMALGAIVGRGAVLDAAYASLSWEDHRVAAGETIDSILADRDLPDVGLGRLVGWVLERNGLPGAAIVPGQVLSVPR